MRSILKESGFAMGGYFCLIQLCFPDESSRTYKERDRQSELNSYSMKEDGVIEEIGADAQNEIKKKSQLSLYDMR